MKKRTKNIDVVKELNSAQYALENKKYGRAKKKFELVLENNEKIQKNAQVWALYGITLYNLKDRQKSLEAFINATNIERINGNYWFRRGLIEEELQKLDDAKKSFEKAYKFDPKDEEKAFAIANLLKVTKSSEDALKFLKKQTKRFSNSSNILLRIASLMIELDRKKEAEIYLEKNISKSSTPTVAVALGHHYLQSKNYDQAILIFSKALTKFTDYNLFFGLGLAFHAQKNYQEALVAYNKAGKLNTNSQELNINLARVNIALNNKKEAIENLYSARKQKNVPIDATILLVTLLIEENKPNKAMKVLEVDKKYHKKSSILSFYQGLASIKLENLDIARKFFESSLKNDSNFIDSKIKLIELDMQENKEESALARLEKVLNEHKNNRKAIYLAMKIYTQLQKWELIVHILEPYVKKNYSDTTASQILNSTWKKLNMESYAKKFFEDLYNKTEINEEKVTE